MFKMIIFVKRKAGMSHAEFVDYYENHHAVLAVQLAPSVRKYIRNYIYPIANENYAADTGEDGPVDCVTEVWYDNEQAFEATVKDFLGSNKAEIIMQDEGKVFDREAIRWFKAVVHESELKARNADSRAQEKGNG